MTNNKDFNYIYKIILIGDSGVGKSSIVSRFVDGTFMGDTRSTVGIDLQVKTLDISYELVKIQIWDTAGQEKYKSITQSYYRYAAGIIIVFDLTKQYTFENVINWINEIEKSLDQKLCDLDVILIGNKADLVNDREVKKEEVLELQKKHKFIYIETSAKDNSNINEAFKELVSNVHKHGQHIYCSKYNDIYIDDYNDYDNYEDDSNKKIIYINNGTNNCGCVIL